LANWLNNIQRRHKLNKSYIAQAKIVNVKLFWCYLEEVGDFDLTNQVLLDTPKSG
jgi:hypothetical protein